MEAEVKKANHVSSLGAKLPSSRMSLTHLISPSVLAKVTVPAIKILAQAIEQDLFKKISLLKEEDVGAITNEIRDGQVSTRFTDVIATVFRLDNDKDIERFQAIGHTHKEGESNGTFLARIFVENNDDFTKIALRSAGDFYFDDRAYTIFCPVRSIAGLDTFQFTNEILQLVRERCRAHFKNRNYTDYCELITGNYGQHHGISIDRGSLESGAAKVAKNGKAFFGTDRFQKTDNMFFDKETGFVWISVQNVNRADLKFYIQLMSEILTGKIDSFKPIKFNFSFLSSNDLPSLISAGVGNVTEIRLRMATPYPKLNRSRKGPYTTEKHPQDCLIKYSDFMEERLDSKFKVVKLHAILDARSGLKDVIEIKESSIKTGNQIKESDMQELLRHLNMLPKGYYDA